jgi:hypothetical protein
MVTFPVLYMYEPGLFLSFLAGWFFCIDPKWTPHRQDLFQAGLWWLLPQLIHPGHGPSTSLATLLLCIHIYTTALEWGF